MPLAYGSSMTSTQRLSRKPVPQRLLKSLRMAVSLNGAHWFWLGRVSGIRM